MKKIFNTQHNANGIDWALLLMRVSIALLMLVHGLPKFSALFSGDIKFPSVLGMSPALSLGLAVFAEVFCSILILIGLGTRLAVIPLIITMLVAVFHIHGSDPFVKQEAGLHYLLVYITLLITGSGRFSVDALFRKDRVAMAY